MGKLSVTVKRGRGLIPCDKTGSSDPLCFVSCANSDEFRTKTCEQTLVPVWMETFEFDVMKARMPKLRISVMDADDDGSTDFLGLLEMPVVSLEPDKIYSSWCALTDAAGVPGGQHGEIELDVCYKPDAHEDRSTMDGRDKRYVEKAEDTLLFAARMVNEEVRAEQARADGLMEEDGSDEEADRAGPDWLAGSQKYGTWKELVHGKPEQIRMPTGFVVEAFPTRVKQQAAYLFVGSS